MNMPEQSNQLDDADIRAIALDCGFKLKPQPSGLVDLNPYVYRFAREILSATPRAEDVKALRERLTQPPPAQEDEPVAEIVCEDMGRPFNAAQIRVHFYKDAPPVGTKLYAHPDNSELYKAAEELISIFDRIKCLESRYGPCPAIEDLRAAMLCKKRPDNSGLRKAAEEVVSSLTRWASKPFLPDWLKEKMDTHAKNLRAALEGK